MAVKVGDKKTLTGKLLKAPEDDGAFEAVFATLNVKDHDGDVIPDGAIGQQRAFLAAWQHTHSKNPTGGGDIFERDGKAIMRGDFIDSEDAQEVRKLMQKFPDLFEFSFGFFVSDVKFIQGTPHLLGLDVYEVSPVYRGAGIDTQLLSVKSADATPEQYQSLKGPLTELLELTKARRASQ